jgi:xanthine/CO dehydrogenase XdhC/CoxF family maturation factor
MKGLQEIFATVSALAEPAALATLVRVKGSSYRQPGARMLFGPAGIRAGVISAGCLETDILARVEAVLASAAPQLAAYDMGSDLDLIWGTGMGCQGKADVLLERVDAGQPPEWLARGAAMLEQRRAGALATVFAARGEGAGAGPGAHFLWDAADGGDLTGPAADGALDQALRMAMARTLERGTPGAATLPSGSGELDLLLEPILPPFALWILGAGEHARPLADLAKGLGWFVGIVDHRPALATRERFPQADRIVVGHPPESLRALPLDARSAALVVSHVFEPDRRALEALLRTPIAYLGLQGNRLRSQRLLEEIAQSGLALSEAQRSVLHFPAGLDIGAETPEVIALAMIAEVQAVLAGYPGGSLRDRAGAIHARRDGRPLSSAWTADRN